MDEISFDQKADCCGLTRLQSMNDGFDVVRVGGVIVCGECLRQASSRTSSREKREET